MGSYSDRLFSRKARNPRGNFSAPATMAPGVPDPKLKGVRGGNCNRTVCQAPGAFAWSMNNHAYYCDACARMLNNDPSNHAYWKQNYGVDRFVFRVETLTEDERAKWAAKNAHVPEE